MPRSDLLSGVLVGAGLMYLLDPDKGRRRRALLRDQFRGSMRDLNQGFDASVRDLRHRSYGVLAETRSRFTRDDADAPVLEARVRSRLGRVVSHPGAVHVMSADGVVTLSGQVLASELDGLLAAVRSVPGVGGVENHLEVHTRAGNIPSLQGEGRRPGNRLDVTQQNWSPATRLLASLAGGTLALYGVRVGGLTGTLFKSLGAGLLTRGLANIEVRGLVGADTTRRVIDIHKSINVDAAVEEVFRFWSHFENFPRFMGHLREVRVLDKDRSHWVASGPAGVPVEWDAEITQWIENRVIGWRSVPGSTVGSAGVVRFQPNEQGGTRVDVRMTYNPPAGALGHAVASLLGADPKHAMDEDLVRFKSLIEEGKTSANGQDVRRSEFADLGSSAGFDRS
jgi:uncharacterized membrane protein